MALRDSPAHYGDITRALHWGMAGLLAWQFTTALTRVLVSDSVLDEFLWSTHKASGSLLMSLIVVRGLWALANLGRRPPGLNRPAVLGHLALYGLMVIVPGVALLRQYGSGRAFSPFDIPLMAGFDGEIEWMVALGSALHGLLGWTLLALTLGHVAMAVLHRVRGEDVMERMLGSRSG